MTIIGYAALLLLVLLTLSQQHRERLTNPWLILGYRAQALSARPS